MRSSTPHKIILEDWLQGAGEDLRGFQGRMEPSELYRGGLEPSGSEGF